MTRALRETMPYRDAALSFLVLLGLALPFIPLPGDRPTRIAIHFQGSDPADRKSVTGRTSATICQVLALAMAYEEPTNGGHLRVHCGKPAARFQEAARPLQSTK